MSFGYNQNSQRVKRKVFISYYHKDDQHYRNEFERIFGHLFISKSVNPGDINTDSSDEYIKRLIQQDYLNDCSVLIVLIGPKTLCRKHVDWETSAALNTKVGGNSGVFGILLPTHPDANKGNYQYANIPERLADNVKSGYAKIYEWPQSDANLVHMIETAFSEKTTLKDKIDNSRPQYQNNRCD